MFIWFLLLCDMGYGFGKFENTLSKITLCQITFLSEMNFANFLCFEKKGYSNFGSD